MCVDICTSTFSCCSNIANVIIEGQIKASCARLTGVEVIERPPEGAVGDVGEQRGHVASVETFESVGSKDLQRDVAGLTEGGLARRCQRHLGFDLEAGQMLTLALHHQLL